MDESSAREDAEAGAEAEEVTRNLVASLRVVQDKLFDTDSAPARMAAIEYLAIVENELADPATVSKVLRRPGLLRNECRAMGLGLLVGKLALDTTATFATYSTCCAFAIGLNEICHSAMPRADRRRVLEQTHAWLQDHYFENGEWTCSHALDRRALQLVEEHLAEIADEDRADERSAAALASRDLFDALQADVPLLGCWLAADPRAFEHDNAARIAAFDTLVCEAAVAPTGAAARLAGEMAFRRGFQAAEYGLRLGRPLHWARRVDEAAARLHLDGEPAGKARDCLDYAAALLLPSPSRRRAKLLALADRGTFLGIWHFVKSGLERFEPVRALAMIETVLRLGTPHEKQVAADALRHLAETRARMFPGEVRDYLGERLAGVDRRLFAINAAKAASGDRWAMLALADMFEQGATLPVGVNALKTGWKEAYDWRLKALSTTSPILAGDDAPPARDNLDRRALYAIALQHSDGRGVVRHPGLAARLLARASDGDGGQAARSALALARIELKEVTRSRRGCMAPFLKDPAVSDRLARIFALLDQAIRAEIAGAGFTLGTIIAQPWGHLWLEHFAPETLRLESPEAAYRKEIQAWPQSVSAASHAARALLARHLLNGSSGPDPAGVDMAELMAAVAPAARRSALGLFAEDPAPLSGCDGLRELRAPAGYIDVALRRPELLHSPSRILLWSGEMLESFERLGGHYDDPSHLRFLQLKSELSDLENNVEASLWSNVAVRASIRAHAAVIAPGRTARPRPRRAGAARKMLSSLVPFPSRAGDLAASLLAGPLSKAEKTIDLSTREVGPRLNAEDPAGVPVPGQHAESPFPLTRFQDFRIDLYADRIRLYLDDRPAPRNGLLTLEDVEVAAALCLHGKGPSLSLESVKDFDEKFLNAGMPRHLAQKVWTPFWLSETDFGRTLYYADYVLTIDHRGRDLCSLSEPFVTAETRPGWALGEPWRTADTVGGIDLTDGARVTLVPKQIAGGRVGTRKRGAIHSVPVPHCNFAVEGAGTEDTKEAEPGERGIGEHDIRVAAARRPYHLTAEFPQMVEAMPVFARSAYLAAALYALREKDIDWAAMPQLEKKLRSRIETYRTRAEKRRQGGDLGYVVLRGR